MSKTIILRHKHIGEPSATKLKKFLIKKGHDVETRDSYDNTPTDILIRWGHSGYYPMNQNGLEINPARSITLGVNKKKSRKLLQDRGVSIPKTCFSTRETIREIKNNNIHFPIIGRKRNHTQGRNIEFIESESDLRDSNSSYFSEYMKKEREFRVYVSGGKAIGLSEKIPKNRNAIAWNTHRGAIIKDLNIKIVLGNGSFLDTSGLLSGCLEAIKATKIIGQDFSGVDLIYYKEKPYIIELNSCPALSNPHKVKIFGESFNKIIERYIKKK